MHPFNTMECSVTVHHFEVLQVTHSIAFEVCTAADALFLRTNILQAV
jgi:hypothetical protein